MRYLLIILALNIILTFELITIPQMAFPLGMNNNASIVPTNYGGTWTAIETGETVLSQFDDIDDFNGFNISSFNEHPAFSADVEVDYANLDTKFRIKSSSPTNYKRVIVTISHTALSSLSDTLIIGSGL